LRDSTSAKKDPHNVDVNSSNSMLILENEVDRFALCEELLKLEEEAFITKRQQLSDYAAKHPEKAAEYAAKLEAAEKKKTKEEKQRVVAGTYSCDFGYIVIGHSKKRSIVIHNCYDEPVAFEVNKKVLAEYGFEVEPASNKPIPAHQSITLTCEAKGAGAAGEKKEGKEPMIQAEGVVALAWAIPVKNGPLYEINLRAEFVLPEVVVSSESIDFQGVVVGQKKVITVSIKNKKPVPVEWSYKQPKGAFGKKLNPWEVIYDITPESGLLQPGELQ
jgi:hypothetical protein